MQKARGRLEMLAAIILFLKKIFIFIYLAMSDLSCCTQDL